MAKSAKDQPPDYLPTKDPNPRHDEDRWPVHPANTAPKMSATELKVLAADIKKHGLHNPVVYWKDNSQEPFGSKGPFQIYLLDGVNRARAVRLLKEAGHEVEPSNTLTDDITKTLRAFKKAWPSDNWVPDIDPYAYHLSANVYRRHLTNEEKRWQIKQAIAANPQASNRKIAKEVGASDKTVAAARTDMAVPNAEVPQTEHRPLARAEAELRKDPKLSTRELQAKANVGASTATKARAEANKPAAERKPRPDKQTLQWKDGDKKSDEYASAQASAGAGASIYYIGATTSLSLRLLGYWVSYMPKGTIDGATDLGTHKTMAKAKAAAERHYANSKPVAAKPKPAPPAPIEDAKPDPDAPPDFRYFAEWLEGETKHVFAAPEWKGIVEHAAQMPAIYRNRVLGCLKTLADQINDMVADFEPTKH